MSQDSVQPDKSEAQEIEKADFAKALQAYADAISGDGKDNRTPLEKKIDELNNP